MKIIYPIIILLILVSEISGQENKYISTSDLEILNDGDFHFEVADYEHILMPDSINARYISLDNCNVTDSILSLIVGGENFTKLAKKYAIDGIGMKGGELGWFTFDEMRYTFSKACFSRNIGDLIKIKLDSICFIVEILKISSTKYQNKIPIVSSNPYSGEAYKFYKGDSIIGYFENGILKKELYLNNGKTIKTIEYFKEDINGIVLSPNIQTSNFSSFDEITIINTYYIKVSEYYQNGKINKEYIKHDNSYHGVYKCFYENGDLFQEIEYSFGQLLNVKSCYDKKGNALEKGTIKDGNGSVNIYNFNGELQETIYVENGKIK